MTSWRQRLARGYLRLAAERALTPPWVPGHLSWRDLRNLGETLRPGADPQSRVCDWKWSSYLEVCRGFPRFGGRLLEHVRREHPFIWKESPEPAALPAAPRLTVIIPCRGDDRLETCAAVVRSFWGQTESAFEILIVRGPNDGPLPPEWNGPRLRTVICPDRRELFSRSAYFNAGVRAAQAPFVLLHDGDIAIPADFVHGVLQRLEAGFDVVQPVRFLFYLEAADNARLLSSAGRLWPRRIAEVRQNFAGGTVAFRRAAYWEIGGMDDEFAGWGREDIEFQERFQTLRVYPGRSFPALHLWHADIRYVFEKDNLQRYRELAAIPVAERIARLRARNPGADKEISP